MKKIENNRLSEEYQPGDTLVIVFNTLGLSQHMKEKVEKKVQNKKITKPI